MAYSLDICLLKINNLFSTSFITLPLMLSSFFTPFISLLSSLFPSSLSTPLIFLLPYVYLAPFLLASASPPIYQHQPPLPPLLSHLSQSPIKQNPPFLNISNQNNTNTQLNVPYRTNNTSIHNSTIFKNFKKNKKNRSFKYNKDILTILKPSYLKNTSLPFIFQNDHPSIQRQRGRRLIGRRLIDRRLIGRLHPSRRLSRMHKRKKKYRKRLLLNARQKQRNRKSRVLKKINANKRVSKNGANKKTSKNYANKRHRSARKSTINSGSNSILKDFLRYNKQRKEHSYLTSREAKLRKKSLRRSFTQSLSREVLDQAVDVIADSQYKTNYPIKSSGGRHNGDAEDYKSGKINATFNVRNKNDNIKNNNVDDFDDEVPRTNVKNEKKNVNNKYGGLVGKNKRRYRKGHTNQNDNQTPVYPNKQNKKITTLQVLNEKTNNKMYIKKKSKHDKSANKKTIKEDNLKENRSKIKESERSTHHLSNGDFTKDKPYPMQARKQFNMAAYPFTNHHREYSLHSHNNRINRPYKQNYRLSLHPNTALYHKHKQRLYTTTKTNNNYTKQTRDNYTKQTRDNYTKQTRDKYKDRPDDKKYLINPLRQLKLHSSWMFESNLKDLNAETCSVQTSTHKIKEAGCKSTYIQTKFCYGKCNSFYVPKIGMDGISLDSPLERIAFKSCSFCRPSQFEWVTVLLRCPRANSRGFKKKRMQVIKDCFCAGLTIK